MSAFAVATHTPLPTIHCNCGAHDEIAVALERTGAAEGAYMLAWRARGRLVGFYAVVVVLVLAMGAMWLDGRSSDAQVGRTRAHADQVDGELAIAKTRIDALEAQAAEPPVVVAAAAPAPAGPAQEPASPAPDEETPTGGPQAPAAPVSAPPATTLPTPAVAEPAPSAPLVDGCIAGLCIKVG